MRINAAIQRHVTIPARILLILTICSLLASCSGGISLRSMPAERPIQWPPLPLPAKVSWVRNISNYMDAGITRSTWKYMIDFIFGEKESAIGRPYGVFVDGRERLFVVDVKLRRVHVMDSKENRYDVIDNEKQDQFQIPIAIAEDDNNNVYITDSEAGIVYRYDFRTRILAPFISNLLRPTGIAFNKSNRLLYVSETSAHQIVLFDLNGKERFHIGRRGEGPGQLNFPTDLFVDRTGKLYVTDPINARIQVLSAEGAFILAFGRAGDAPGEFSKPKGVAVDSEGNIYVCDALRDSVQVFDAMGNFQLEFGDQGQDSGTFWMPSGIYIDDKDMIYVADTYNQRIQVFRHSGRTAPTGGLSGSIMEKR